MWHIHAMEYYSAIKRNEVPAHATTRINFGNITLSINRRSQAQNKFHVYEMSRRVKSIGTESRIVGAQS